MQTMRDVLPDVVGSNNPAGYQTRAETAAIRDRGGPELVAAADTVSIVARRRIVLDLQNATGRVQGLQGWHG